MTKIINVRGSGGGRSHKSRAAVGALTHLDTDQRGVALGQHLGVVCLYKDTLKLKMLFIHMYLLIYIYNPKENCLLNH